MPSRHADWLAQAKRDFDHAEDAAKAGHFEWSCFAAHQASEKALKALFLKRGMRVVAGHSLRQMLEALKRRERVPLELGESARLLDRHYIPSRYPDAHPAGAPFDYYTKAEAAEAVIHARKIVRFCENHIA
ncbi:MAG: HEPN domain-containing protein [Chloroflexi bacterium]|nr:HEPN domain-containing protein [Chloroflexota bacterium]